MKKIAILSLLMLSMFTVAGCSMGDTESRFVESGFSVGNRNNEPTPWLSTAVKAENKQEEIANFSVYAGYARGFIDKWNSFVANPGYGKFALQRSIRDLTDIEINNLYFDLPYFDDESKYLVTYQEADDGSDRILSRRFIFNFKDTIHLDEITIEQGYVCYLICLMDDDNQVIEGDLFGGISIGNLYFVKSDSQITFSEYGSVFTE